MPKLLPLKDFGVERVLTKEGFALRRPAARLALELGPAKQELLFGITGSW
jgi:hypothetical protein